MKVKRYEQDSDAYKIALFNQMKRFCPPSYPCCVCGYPVIKGYCCNNCGDTNPSDPNDSDRQPIEFEGE